MDTLENQSTDLIQEPTDTSDKIAKILKYKEEGYLFHGSDDSAIDTLEPRQARSVDELNKVSNDSAVYASSNPQVCVMGVVRSILSQTKSIGGDWDLYNRGEDYLTAAIPKSWKQLIEKGTGILYVLPSNSFFLAKFWQSKSYEKVKPIDRINVTFNDFLTLGGKVVWKEDK